MVSFSEKLKDGMERARIVMLWTARLDALVESRADFCRNYEIDGGQLSKWVNGKHLPDWTSIERVEQSLKKAGV